MSINTLTYNKSIFHFLSGMQGSVPNRMLLSCPFRDAFMVYCTQESCRMEESSCIWQLPAQSLILVRAGQTPAVAPAATKTLHFSSFLAEGKLPFCTDSEPAVFVPIPGSDLFDFCTELAAQPPSAETDRQAHRAFRTNTGGNAGTCRKGNPAAGFYPHTETDFRHPLYGKTDTGFTFQRTALEQI